MSDDKVLEDQTVASAEPQGIGPQLRAAREAKGLSIDHVAAETRISKRHIEHIEAGDFDLLPARTYAVGFSRTLAKVVGLDQNDVLAMVRAELDAEHPREHSGAAGSGTKFEPGDPARAPGGKLVWFSLFAVVLLLIGIFFAARVLFSPAAELPRLTDEEAEQVAAAGVDADAQAGNGTQQAIDPAGEVVFTAEGEAWVRFYDAQNRVLTERTMQEGESFTIPATAEGPRIITGRPDLLAITIGGRNVPKLSEELETLSDVEVSAAALLAREGATAPNAPQTATTPEN
ncbi:MAG: DUF4115 domain-containing protein [Alteraurantiacibacter sp. bin_em_oilr2.035]|nr:DUF4115 domain-containing protein [Alteraurantiacibacter sp. bin_em_oilr2.035]